MSPYACDSAKLFQLVILLPPRLRSSRNSLNRRCDLILTDPGYEEKFCFWKARKEFVLSFCYLHADAQSFPNYYPPLFALPTMRFKFGFPLVSMINSVMLGADTRFCQHWLDRNVNEETRNDVPFSENCEKNCWMLDRNEHFTKR